VTGWS